MLWSEPWLALASSAEGTRIPPPRPVLPAGWRFKMEGAAAGITAEWLAFVGTGLGVAEARRRLGERGLVASLFVEEGRQRVATCVLRPVADRVWSLETFVARPRGQRFGEWLLRCVMWSLWGSHGATLVFQWELRGLPTLIGAAWRGWLQAAQRIDYGWRWRRAAEAETCGFCPVTAAWLPPSSQVGAGGELTVEGVTVVDSGLCDGWGYILEVPSGGAVIDWTRVAAAGGWRELWWAGAVAPSRAGWHWTGEWIVHGRVGLPVVGVAGVERRYAEIPFAG